MLAKESAVPTFDLPEEVLSILPSDPFEQLDIARKITSIALATRVSKLESESSFLRSKLDEKEDQLAELQSQIESLDASLSQTSDKLAQAHEEKERLLKENASLSATVRKLNRDVSKLEIFRKTLVQSLQEEEDSAAHAVAKQIQPNPSFIPDEDASLPPSKSSSFRSQFSNKGDSLKEDGGSAETDAYRHGTSHGPLLVSYSSTPQLTPPISPPTLSAAASPTRRSKAGSPRRHSISFATSRGVYEDRTSVFSSLPSSNHSSVSSSMDMTSQTGRTRVDGKEFFRQVRSRLSYEQFGAFLANVKELNSHKQTREETLRKADEIFGPENKDLYVIFEGLITRNMH
ncbi:Ph-response transcription factor [Thalictrum thalictroides]|uniref:Ph-response transcription factor n=1 Tax=Thalictrum thalictroides TaxID=46969 RepID=A0A7J6XFY7_THATH|nr:Ph-response transcription factor [Thalictrum thalictroides]